jgi:Peptidase family M28
MQHKSGLALIAIAILVSFFSIWMDSPPAVIDAAAPDSVFSAQRANVYLKEICQAPHSTGTQENKRVREYIAEQCKQWGLDTHIQNTTAIRRHGQVVTAANVYNVLARLKGQRSDKALLVMAHYDTQPNTPGAGDDGAGVAAMLETARILASTKVKLQNDVFFLFTDAEEQGLLGARGFIQDSTLTSEVGLVLNFEGRGNSGVSSMFEVNAQNGWAVEHYMKSAAYPNGNSLSYEIYKSMPNDTDYTVFRQAGISGLNNAFIEGFVNYHSPTDKSEMLDLRSLQHHGSNMLSLVKHFGNISLLKTKAEDISFFTLIGNVMVRYPASWNLYFVIFSYVLFVVWFIMGVRKKKITVKGFIVGFFCYIGVIILLVGATLLFVWAVKSFYPNYAHFYSFNSYNIGYYFLAITGLAILLYSLVYRWLINKTNVLSLFAGILLIHLIVLTLSFIYIPTAIFIFVFPLLFALMGNIILIAFTFEKSGDWVQLLFLIPAILFFPTTLKFVFIAFGLTPELGGVALLMALFLGLLLPLFSRAMTETRYYIPIAALSFFVVMLIVAHSKSDYSVQEPLQSNVQYQLRSDEDKAYWISSFANTDTWSEQFFTEPFTENGKLFNTAPLLPLSAPTAVVKKDTMENNVRKLTIHCHSTRDAIAMSLEIEESNLPVSISLHGPAGGTGNKELKKGEYWKVNYFGLDSTGFDVTFELKPGDHFAISLNDVTMGLPDLKEMRDYPEHIIPSTDWTANTTQVRKKYVF